MSKEIQTQSDEVVPIRYATELLTPWPNPFNPRVEIAFTLERAEAVEITVYDVRGRQITTLLSEGKAAGRHSVIWEGKDSRGSSVASGAYFVRLRAGDLVTQKRVALLR